MGDPFEFNGLRMHATKTAPNGVVGADTIFEFRHSKNIVCADYAGGRVIEGHLIGRLDGAGLTFRYCQVDLDGNLDGGVSKCEIERLEDGRLRLTERFQWESRGDAGENIIEELPR